jgi:hypothetical protein
VAFFVVGTGNLLAWVFANTRVGGGRCPLQLL